MKDENVIQFAVEALELGYELTNIIAKKAQDKELTGIEYFSFNTLSHAAAFAIMILSQAEHTSSSLEDYKNHCISAIEMFLKLARKVDISKVN